jgi:hypothetical protein
MVGKDAANYVLLTEKPDIGLPMGSVYATNADADIAAG